MGKIYPTMKDGALLTICRCSTSTPTSCHQYRGWCSQHTLLASCLSLVVKFQGKFRLFALWFVKFQDVVLWPSFIPTIGKVQWCIFVLSSASYMWVPISAIECMPNDQPNTLNVQNPTLWLTICIHYHSEIVHIHIQFIHQTVTISTFIHRVNVPCMTEFNVSFHTTSLWYGFSFSLIDMAFGHRFMSQNRGTVPKNHHLQAWFTKQVPYGFFWLQF